METIKINRGNIVYGVDEIDVKAMMEVDGRLLILFTNDILNKIGIGSSLFFKRIIYSDNEANYEIGEDVTVLEKTKYKYDGKTYNAVYTTIPNERRLTFAENYNLNLHFVANSGQCRNNYDAYFDDVHHYMVVFYEGEFNVADWLYYYGGDEPFFIVEFDEDHQIFQQDIDAAERNGGYTMSVLTPLGSKIGTIDGLSIPFTGTQFTVEKDDCLTTWTEETCGKFDESGKTYEVIHHKYTHTPSVFSRRRIKFSKIETSQISGSFFDKGIYLITHGMWFVPKYNPFYYFFFNSAEKMCSFWKDEWWEYFDLQNGGIPVKEVWENSGNTRSYLGMESAFWNVPSIVMSSDRASSLGIEEEQATSYVDEIIDAVIPDYIDMEKVKYIPVIMGNGGKYDIATAITFDFHFRKREEIARSDYDREMYPYPKYLDRWNISDASGATVWWNGMEYYGNSFNRQAFTDFYMASGKTSDMLGYLNFSDDDIYYRKSKVSKSFIRISFYSSKDPIEQKLLYYSTSFLDSTSLYGKYMKQYVVKSDNGDNDNIPIVFYDNNIVSARLDTEIVIKNEYQHDSSSEGFNLYLFADDADGVNSDRTIYMKVEFNHAGNGKTIPMIMWPKNGSMYKALTVDNFIDNLYIPVKIKHIDGKFVYYIPGAENDGNNINLVLFEPKLDYFESNDFGRDSNYEPPTHDDTIIDEDTNQGNGESSVGYDTESHTSGNIWNGGNEGGGEGQGGGVVPVGPVPELPSKKNKQLYFGNYYMDTLYGIRIAIPIYTSYGSITTGMLKLETDNPSIVRIDPNNYTLRDFSTTWGGIVPKAWAHITPETIRGTGQITVKVSNVRNPSVYDTCIVNILYSNQDGETMSDFANGKHMVSPWIIYVKRGAMFEIWTHHWGNSTQTRNVTIDDPTAITFLGPGHMHGGAMYEMHVGLLFVAGDKTGTYHVNISLSTYEGTKTATVHIIDN